ncbi:SDR family NAD(P)-dependent oxidoreductase [Paenibacillus pinisoli]|uniref:SDR family NAD(P)-dependent oxidoreductase n=2 Tax=Paenibacillus pinisoli TaxID=1276110 RepID=A0A3A6PLW9_9BACL|nr:SDR family oxidoreductase [Paenibacillus pinisoli]RJX39239.1 SDR family NAD(P)-dependent oxidoreductase [Paenibacillus pinisoli]
MSTNKPLKGKIAVVAGATRGAGRGIAVSLGEAGATVYCTGRSIAGSPSDLNRSETVQETAQLVTEAGGNGIAVRVDHTNEADVAALFEQIKREQNGQLDVLVNNVWGGEKLVDWDARFWKHSLANGLLIQERAVKAHLITSYYGAPLMLEQGSGLVVEITDGIDYRYRGNLFYSLAKISSIHLAEAMAAELKPHGVSAVAVTPGFLRSEEMLEHYGVAETNWQDAVGSGKPNAEHFGQSETPRFIGRGIAALAADPDYAAKSGAVLASWDLSDLYGIMDIDGRYPHWGRYAKERGFL